DREGGCSEARCFRTLPYGGNHMLAHLPPRQNEKSTRSARRHKARGVSPGIECKRMALARGAGDRSDERLMIGSSRKMVHLRRHEIEHTMVPLKAVARSAGWTYFSISILGLTPQALCWRPLRGLVSQLYDCRFNGSSFLILTANHRAEATV